MSKYDVGLVIPTYGAFEYAKTTIESAFEHTQGSLCVLMVDDASPDWEAHGVPLYEDCRSRYGHARFRSVRYVENGGLTRSWNCGLNYFNSPECEAEHICCANSDLIFTRNWDLPLRAAAEAFALVGPMTNTPGTCEEQDYKTLMRDLRLTDDPKLLDREARFIAKVYAGMTRQVKAINGFCLFARRDTWFSGAFAQEEVFRPRNDFNSKGQRNPTPLMTLNEDELQHRWTNLGRKFGICFDSLVFHYRSVSRGERYAKGDWQRKK